MIRFILQCVVIYVLSAWSWQWLQFHVSPFVGKALAFLFFVAIFGYIIETYLILKKGE